MNTPDSDSLFDYCIKAIESSKKLSKEEIIALKDSYEEIRKNK